MALSSTIFKVKLNVADMDRHYYADHTLTIARHPSETNERMMIRLLGFAMYASEHLEFGKGLSSDDEPALWEKDLTGTITRWIEVGLPEEKIIRRACGRADEVMLILYGSGRTTEMWWQSNRALLAKQENLTIESVAGPSCKALALMAESTSERSLDIQVTIQDGEVWFANALDRIKVEMIRYFPSPD